MREGSEDEGLNLVILMEELVMEMWTYLVDNVQSRIKSLSFCKCSRVEMSVVVLGKSLENVVVLIGVVGV